MRRKPGHRVAPHRARAIVLPLVAAALLAAAAPPSSAAPQPLAIDTLLNSTLYGGNSYEIIGAGAVDGAGNIYLTGYTYSTDLTSGVANPYDGELNGTTDAFVAKLDPTGSSLLWATYLGGDSFELGYAVAAAANGTVYVGGRSYGAGFPTTPGAADRSYTGYYGDGYVTAFSSAGALLWSTYLGGGLIDQVEALAIGPRGTVFAAGYTTSLDFPTTNQVWDGSANGGQDAFLVALSPADGAMVFGTYLGGSANDSVASLAIDSSGRAVLLGETLSDDFPTTPGAYQRSLGGEQDLFVTRVNETGAALLSSTYIGGSANETAGGVALDSSSRPTVSGSTLSPNFVTTPGAYDRVRDGQDAFALRLAADASSLNFSTFLGGAGTESSADLALTPDGDILLLGQTSSTSDFPTTTDAKFSTYRGGAQDLFVSRLDASGSRLQYSTYFGGSATDFAKSIDALGVDRAVTTGYTLSSTFATTTGAFDRTLTGTYDAFASEFKTAYRVSYATSPAGLAVNLGGADRPTPFVVACPFDESLAVSAAGVQQQGDTRYVFSAWTNLLPQTHVLRCTGDGDYTASYETEYRWTVTASRPNVTVRVNNVTVDAPYTWWCPKVSGAYIDVQVNQTGNGSRLTFTSWSDGGARAHSLPCQGPGTVRAEFSVEYAASILTEPPGLVLSTVPAVPAPLASFWCPEGQPLVVSATAVQQAGGTRYAFSGWADGSGALPRSVTCNGPLSLTARFGAFEHLINVTTQPPGLNVVVSGNGVTAPYSAWCPAGNSVNLSAPSPQERGGVRHGFSSWAGWGDVVTVPETTATCDRPLMVVASFAPSEFRIRMVTDPPGLRLQVGPEDVVAPFDEWCTAGLSVVVNAPSPQVDGGTRHSFAGWSTNRTQAHAAPCDGTSELMASFTQEVRVAVATQPSGLNMTIAGTTVRAPAEAWCPLGGTVAVAAPEVQEGVRSRFVFDAWTDGQPRERAVTCDGPTDLVARFDAEFEVRITTLPPGLVVAADGQEHVAPFSVYWQANTTHEVEFASPQTQGVQTYEFASWSDGGPARHSVTPGAPMNLVASAVATGLGDFAVDAEVPEIQVGPGSSAVLVVSLREVNTYTGPPVDVTVVDAPEGVTARCVPAPVEPGGQCALEVKVAPGVPPGEYTLTLRASNGTTAHTKQFVLNVPPEGSIEATSPTGWLLPLAAALLVIGAGALALLTFMRWRRGKSVAPDRPPADGRDEKD